MKTDKRTLTAIERRKKAFELRKSGLTYEKIGMQIGISMQAAHGLIKRELTRLSKQAENDATLIRTLEIERLDDLIAAVWNKAIEGDLGSIDRVLKISERRARFLGLDALVKTEIAAVVAPTVGIYLPDNGRGDMH